MENNKTRVDFNAPSSLVERADIIAELLDTTRTQLLIKGLRKEINNRISDKAFKHKVREKFYNGEIDFEVVKSVFGTDEAVRMNLLRDSLDRDPPIPETDIEYPTQEEFYDGELPKWIPEDSSDEKENLDTEKLR